MTSYYFPKMKPKSELFNSSNVSSTDDYYYSNWLRRLDGYDSKWPTFVKRFAEDFQFAVLRGMTVVGATPASWNDVFRKILDERDEFSDLSRLYLQGKLRAEWRVFGDKLAKGRTISTHYPPIYPEWLLAYGYTQRQYVDDLSVYWDNVADAYYKLWEGARFGADSPAVARLKQLGEIARQEIDDVARHAAKHTRH